MVNMLEDSKLTSPGHSSTYTHSMAYCTGKGYAGHIQALQNVAVEMTPSMDGPDPRRIQSLS